MTRANPATPTTFGDRRRAWRELRHTPEGRIYRGARLVVIVYAVLLGVAFHQWPDHAEHFLAMTALNVFIGRAGGMAYGYSVGYQDLPVIGLNGLVETLMVLLLHPLFHFSWHRMLEIPSLKPLMVRTREAAERNQGTIRRYGPLGLLVFVFTPFAMTGPVVGAAIGVMLGLPTRTILACVLTGTYVACLAWAYALRGVAAGLAAFDIEGSVLLIGAVAAIFLLWLLRRRHAGSKIS
jgi:uncharacterized membrane protein